MSRPAPAPDFPRIQRALRATTARLVEEIRAPTPEPPDWNSFEWSVARSAVAMLGLAGVLAQRLRWREPAHFTNFVHQQREHIAGNQQRVLEMLSRLDAALRPGGLPVVGLKGAAILRLDLHGRGVRPMADIDLLARPEHFAAVARAIESRGYRRAQQSERHLAFRPSQEATCHAYAEHPDNPLRIELHVRVYEPLPASTVDITSMIWPPDARPGVNGYASLAALMRHLLLHAAGAMSTHTLRGVQPYDIAVLAGRMGLEDWRDLVDRERESTWWIYPPLLLADSLAPGSIPAWVLARAAADCPPLLRQRARRYDLHAASWCNLRISAFPAVAWSRTPLEALRYMRGRAFPNRTALGKMRDSLESVPAHKTLPWYQLDQRQRMLRWLLGRPPRVQTMTSVMAACAEAGCEFP